MDLIYADETRKDLGVLQSYSLDMAYGTDENDFQCAVDRRDHCCSKGYFIYVENEEYGGIVDSIRVAMRSSTRAGHGMAFWKRRSSVRIRVMTSWYWPEKPMMYFRRSLTG